MEEKPTFIANNSNAVTQPSTAVTQPSTAVTGNPFNLDPMALLTQQARRTGGIVFGYGAVIQMLAYFLIGMGGLIHTYSRMERMFELRRSFIDFLLERDISLLLVGSIVSGAVFILTTSLLGRKAGKAIGIRKNRFGWVGLLTMLLPSFFAGISCMCIAIFAISFNHIGKSDLFFDNFIYPTLAFSAAFFIPAVVTGVLSGLIVRQICRGREYALRMQSGIVDE